MMKNKTKKVVSAIAVLALSATAISGIASIASLNKGFDYVSSTANGKSQIVTAEGVVQTRDSGTKWYVAPNGTPNAAGTEEDPYAIGTLLRSTVLQPGDTVYVEPGVYKISDENINIRVSGEFNKYIKIVNRALYDEDYVVDPEVGDKAVLDFSGLRFLSTNRGVQLYGNYMYWFGIDICGAGDNGLYIGGSHNTVEYCEFYNNRDTGLQLGRAYESYGDLDTWPSYNLIKDCTSHNNYDNETYGENADGFAAKLTVGYGNVFDGCIAYRNSDDGWDLYAKTDTGNIGAVIMYNCVAFENGYLEYTQQECNKLYPTWDGTYSELRPAGSPIENLDETNRYGRESYYTRDGDGNGFKLGGSIMEGDVILKNCLSFHNKMHGVTDNSNPGVLYIEGVTSYDNSAVVDDDPSSSTFGQVVSASQKESHGNIDVSRQTYSYNNLRNVLSVKTEMTPSLEKDAYRGSVTDSVLLGAGFVANYIEGSLDADTKNSGGKTFTSQGNQLVASEIFKQLPVDNGTYNIDGKDDLYTDIESLTLNPDRVHIKYRNDDYSINMRDILAKKDGVDETYFKGMNVGSVLNKEHWEDYEHFFTKKTSADYGEDSEEATIIARALETLQLSCDPKNVYQDFHVSATMNGLAKGSETDTEWKIVEITWEVVKLNESDPDVLEVGETTYNSINGAGLTSIIVNRPADADVNVQLVATLVCEFGGNSVTETKTFDLTVKQGDPSLGKISVVTKAGDIYNDGSVIIVDKYANFDEPKVQVENGLDYNGKILSEDLYTLETTYMYATDSNSAKTQLKYFTASHAGVYTITNKATIKKVPEGGVESVSMTYTIFVASVDAQVDFSSGRLVTVNKEGYSISGSVSSATGILYALSSDTQLEDVTAENIATYEGVTSVPFRGETIDIQCSNANSGEYYIYYALGNLKGEVTSEVYEQKIEVVGIETAQQFMTIAGGSKIGTEELTTTIYQLKNDIDFNGVSYTVGKSPFRGLLNGMGYTVKNITVNGLAVFYKVNGGTIENIKFENVTIDGGSSQKVGFVSECDGGIFYNIAFTNIDVKSSAQRVGGLIAQINSGSIIIEQVSLINDKDHKIYSGNQRAGGLIGFSQANSGLASGIINVTIKNCYVDTAVEAPFELGGIYGTYDCGNNKNVSYKLTMDSVVFVGSVTATGSKSYAANILGYKKGVYALVDINNCFSLGHVYFSGVEVLNALKNASGLIGGFDTISDELVDRITFCYGLFEDYNSYDLEALDSRTIADAKTYARFDGELWTIEVGEDGASFELNFLGDWSADAE